MRAAPSNSTVGRLIPPWLRAVIITLICLMIAIPVMYVVFGSVNSDIGVADGQYFPRSVGQ